MRAYEITCIPGVRHRRMKLAVHRDGRVTLSYPRRIPFHDVEAFVRSKGAWIARAHEQWDTQDVHRLATYSSEELKERSAEAMQRVASRVEQFSRLYEVHVRRLTIRQPATRWGSCSRQGVLMFNVRLLSLPDHLLDYLVVHEVCHLREFNHSSRFWALVARCAPNHRALRQELRARYVLERKNTPSTKEGVRVITILA